MTPNISKLFYKEYFSSSNNAQKGKSEIDFSFLLSDNSKNAPKSIIEQRNSTILKAPLAKLPNPIGNPNNSFELKIIYPGLVTGVGISHEARIEGEFKLGIHFDYTYGMPIVYGSSVKGVLRSYFKEFYTGNDTDELFLDIFEGKEKGKYKSIYKRDIFLDAVLTQSDSKNHILASDSITPHTAGPLKNPTPLTFLKIAPGCTMEFRFKLVDSYIGEQRTLYSASAKLALFKEIIQTVGVGAKTNVGYGQFE